MNKSKSSFSIAQVVTDEVLTALRSGQELPWIQPWRTADIGVPYNPISKTQYRGINFLMLKLRQSSGSMFVTAKQAVGRGGKPLAGKANPIIYFNFIEKEEKDAAGNKTVSKFPMMKYFNVWSLSHIEGGDFDFKLPPRNIVINALAEQLVGNAGVTRTVGAENAYRDLTREIVMKERQDFITDDMYYGVLFHQLIHSTKAPMKRTVGDNEVAQAFEQMVAELGASMLCAHAGVDGYRTEHTAGYIKHWIKALEGDEKFIVMAAQKAQKAVDYLLGQSYQSVDISAAANDLPLAA